MKIFYRGSLERSSKENFKHQKVFLNEFSVSHFAEWVQGHSKIS